jgi:DNA-binding NarL/FixJ family response regulator
LATSEASSAYSSVGSQTTGPSERIKVHVRRGLIDVLRGDDKIEVSVSEDEGWSPERVSGLSRGGVVILDETSERLEAVELRSARPEVGIVVLAYEPTYTYGMLMLAAGMTCLPWSAPGPAILHAVHFTAQGGCVFASQDGDRIERRDRRKDRVLTRREIDVLGRLSDGMSTAMIATELRISIETVRAYTTSLRRKLKVSSTRELTGLYIPPTLRVG